MFGQSAIGSCQSRVHRKDTFHCDGSRIDKFSSCHWRSSFQFAVTVEDLVWRKPVS